MRQPGERRWPRTDRVWRQFTQLDCVIKRMDIEPLIAARKRGGLALARARDACRGCISDEKCRAWLGQDDNRAALADFCPNIGFFEECRQADRAPDHKTLLKRNVPQPCS